MKWCARIVAAAPTRANMFHQKTFSFGDLAFFSQRLRNIKSVGVHAEIPFVE
jgi:hypothetical protein